MTTTTTTGSNVKPTAQAQRIPATIITGFLGSGKTTVLRHILDNAQGKRIAVIVNEFGELGIDGEILRGCGIGCDEAGEENGGEQAGTLYELANGCLCCTVQEEFYPVMRELVQRRDDIDHIVIETSGLALPKPLVQAFQWPEIRNACTVDAVVTVVDVPAVAAGQFAAQPQAVDAQRRSDPNLDHESPLHELFEDQLSAADLVLLSKTDLADEAALKQVQQMVRAELPESVQLIPCEQGAVDVQVVLGVDADAQDHIHLKHSHHDAHHHHHHDTEGEHSHEHEGEHHHDHDHDAFDSIVVELGHVDKEQLLTCLQTLVQQHTVYRVKGFVALMGKPMRLIVHGVGRRFDSYFDRRWRDDETPHTQLVLIGADLNAQALRAALVVAEVTTA